ncbi:MAG: ankyrin repeat domain-containing protein [Victivallales bacterium]|jgi:ankyrin repeat protein
MIKTFPILVFMLFLLGCESKEERQLRLNHQMLSPHLCYTVEAINEGVDVNFKDREGKTILVKLTERNMVGEFDNVIKYILKNTNIDVNAQDNKGRTALFYSMELCKISLITDFLNYGAEPNIKDKEGNTAIFALPLRARNDGDKIIPLLINKGAIINEINSDHETVLDISIRRLYLDEYMNKLIPLLREYSAKTAAELKTPFPP